MSPRSVLYRLLVPLATAGVACLPIDTRPPPGSVLVSVSSDDTAAGVTTEDGWLVTYDTLLISLGNFGIAEGPCEQYAESHYVRILDLRRPEPQKLALLRALGHCPFIFEVSSPPDNAVLGAGVTEDAKTLMRTPGSDPYVKDRGVGVHAAGVATRGDSSVAFAWSFRENLAYGHLCGELSFESEVTASLDVHVRTASLFDDPEGSAGSPVARFGPFAAADADADGVVTLEELDAVPVALSEGNFATLGARLYRKTARELIEPGGVPCMPGIFTED
jgi:hypothetical protein